MTTVCYYGSRLDRSFFNSIKIYIQKLSYIYVVCDGNIGSLEYHVILSHIRSQKMKNLSDHFFAGNKHVCPWWICFTFDNLLRRFVQNPEKVIEPYVREGDTVLDVGPGMGYFSIPLAKIVGERGRVFAADVQIEMLNALKKRARRAGVEQRIILHLCKEDSLGLNMRFDFALAFWMVHEVPVQDSFFKEIRSLLNPDGKFLMSEPKIHVTKVKFDRTVEKAIRAGFTLKSNPDISLSRSALFGLD